ncbi:MAG: Jag N-terminal domain-containing protein [Flexilinea sp.]|nr:Jag N-terminal domain-containing protein [Flexilinea sp.]
MTSTSLEYIAANAEDAINKGLHELNVTRSEVDIEILDNGSKGIFGIGARQARVRLTIKADSLRASIQKDETPAPAPAAAPEKTEEEPVKPAKEAPVKEESQPKGAKKEAKPAAPKAPRKESKPADEAPAEKDEKPSVIIEKPEIPEGSSDDPVVNEQTMQITANVVRDLLEKMHVNATIQSKVGEAADDVDGRVIMIDIQGDDLSFLIGRHSEVLHSLQYITSLIVGREVGHWVPLVIDVQGYRERRERQLRQMAVRMADQVVKTGRRISLEPMSATERRIIHLALRDNKDIMTESIGEEPNRKVVIYPKEKK